MKEVLDLNTKKKLVIILPRGPQKKVSIAFHLLIKVEFSNKALHSL